MTEAPCNLPDFLCALENHPGLAAWAQAFFSLFALVFALLALWVSLRVSREQIAAGEAREQRERQREIDARYAATYSRHSSIVGICHRAELFMTNWLPFLENEEKRDSYIVAPDRLRAVCKETLADLSEFPAHTLGDMELEFLMDGIRGHTRTFVSWVEGVLDPESPPEYLETAFSEMRAIHERVQSWIIDIRVRCTNLEAVAKGEAPPFKIIRDE